jgi:hypothetical protein
MNPQQQWAVHNERRRLAQAEAYAEDLRRHLEVAEMDIAHYQEQVARRE